MNSLANEDFSLGLVFFDILYLDSKSLLSRSYAERRELLETLIDSTPGKAVLAARYPINMLAKDRCKALYKIFAQHIATSQEGLVLKAEESMYNDYRKPWVKVKRDYLPEAGDQLELVILGAAWEKIRARSLRGAAFVEFPRLRQDPILFPSPTNNVHNIFCRSLGKYKGSLSSQVFRILYCVVWPESR
jgi:DNA ligase-4